MRIIKNGKLRSALLATLALFEIFLLPFALLSQETAKSQSHTDRPSFYVPETSTPLKIDGILNESAWEKAVIIELPYEIDPGENLPSRVKTECLLISDQYNFYVGFRAYDPNPKQIRAHYMDRDLAFDDDWVFITLDPFLDERRGFQFLSNPLGVQMDSLLNEVGSGESEVDATWDAIWNSTGRITPNGYEVEMSIPFTSLRFPKIEGPKKWGFQAMRHYPRNFSYFFRATPWDRNRDCMLCGNVIIVGFERAKPGRNFEWNPTITAHRTDTVAPFPANHLKAGRAKAEPGLSVRWGITPNIQLNSALNPDFSQVEADVAQLEINTRFALYYPEKRPLFLEGADIFKTQLNAVYTRTIADPSWGIKLSGKEQSHAFGILVSQDMTTNLLLPANQASQLLTLNQCALSSILRYRFDMGRQSTVGLIGTNRQGDSYTNRVLGCDGQFQITAADSVGFQFLLSQTLYPKEISEGNDQSRDSFRSAALSMIYRHDARNWRLWTIYENLGRGFRADLGFIPRVDLRSANAGIQRICWGNPGGWYRKLLFTAEGSYSNNQEGKLTDRSLSLSAEVNGPLQSMISLGFVAKKEFFKVDYYDQFYFQLNSSLRPSGTFALSLTGKIGDGVDYTGMRSGKILRISPGVACFFGRSFQVSLEHSLERLGLEEGLLYVANLSQIRFVYQPTARMFIRAILQYLDLDLNLQPSHVDPDPMHRKLFTQLLLSYKINPQTLLFIGYSENRLGQEGAVLSQLDRTFFLKVSYACLY